MQRFYNNTTIIHKLITSFVQLLQLHTLKQVIQKGKKKEREGVINTWTGI
jgi:hypothetical protein